MVGWKHRKELYRALADLGRTSPALIRSLTEAEAAQLISRMTPSPVALRAEGRPPRHSRRAS
jgi:hypothetical protein